MPTKRKDSNIRFRENDHSLLLWTTASVVATSYPANVDFGVVSPRNNTYNNVTGFPVIIAVQNPKAAFEWTGTLGWEISLIYDNIPLDVGGQAIQLSGSVPQDAVFNDIWFAASKPGNDTPLNAGNYKLSWFWTMVVCNPDGSFIYGGTWGGGDVLFTIVEKGGDHVNLTDTCLTFEHRITATDVIHGSCPDVSASGNLPPSERGACKTKLSADVVACVMANVTGSGDQSACQRAAKSIGSQYGGWSLAVSLVSALVVSLVASLAL